MRFEGGAPSGSPVSVLRSTPAASPRRARRGWLPFAAVRPDYDLIPLNGRRLVTEGLTRMTPLGSICSVAFRAELRPSSREVVQHIFDRDASVMTRGRLTGGLSAHDYEQAGDEIAAWSMDSAIAAAATLLGRHVQESGSGAMVEAVRRDAGPIEADDVIVAVDGHPVRTATDVRAALAGRDVVRMTLVRDGSERSETISRLADGQWGIRVVTASRVLQHGIAARFDLPDDVRGPSLGLACALSIIDAYSGGRLAGSGTIVATGTVDLAGRVGGVGAIEYKARAVRAHPHVRRFVVPAEFPEDVEDARRVLGGRVEVVAVTTLSEAVDLLAGPSWRSRKAGLRSADRRPGTVR